LDPGGRMRCVGRGSCARFYPSLDPPARTIGGGGRPLVDLHSSQRRRKGFVGGIESGLEQSPSPFTPTVSGPGGGQFDLTCAFHKLRLTHRTGSVCRATHRVPTPAGHAP
jgi:hypothetical protein